MTAPTSPRNAWHIPDSAKPFIHDWISRSQKTLNDQTLEAKKKIQDLNLLLSKSLSEDAHQVLMQSMPPLNKGIASLNELQKKNTTHLASVEKKIHQLKAHLEDDLKFRQDIFSYENALKEKMKTFDSYTLDQFNSLKRKIQKTTNSATSTIKHLESVEQSFSQQQISINLKHSQSCASFAQDADLLKTQAKILTESLQQFLINITILPHTNHVKQKTALEGKTSTPSQKTTPRKGELILNDVLKGDLDLSKAESQLTSLFEQAFLNQKLNSLEQTALNMSQELLGSGSAQSTALTEETSLDFAHKIILNQEVDHELIAQIIINALTSQVSSYYFVECTGPQRQRSNKTHKELVEELQKALIRSFLETKSQTINSKNITPNTSSLDQIGYSTNFINLLKKTAQKGNLLLIINQKTQLGMPIKLGMQSL